MPAPWKPLITKLLSVVNVPVTTSPCTGWPKKLGICPPEISIRIRAVDRHRLDHQVTTGSPMRNWIRGVPVPTAETMRSMPSTRSGLSEVTMLYYGGRAAADRLVGIGRRDRVPPQPSRSTAVSHSALSCPSPYFRCVLC